MTGGGDTLHPVPVWVWKRAAAPEEVEGVLQHTLQAWHGWKPLNRFLGDVL